VRTRQSWIALTSLAILVWPIAGAQAGGAGSAGYSVVLRQTLAPGLEHLRLRSNTPQDVHIAHFSGGGGQRLKVVESNGRIAQSRSALERPDALCRAVNCLAAVNGDFINGSAQPLGAVVTGGVLLRSPAAGHAQAWVRQDGSLGAGGLGFSGRVEDANRAGFSVAGVNVDRGKDSVTVYTAAYGAKTPTGKGLVELVTRADDPGQVARLGATATLSLTQIKLNSTGGTPIPPGTVVISAQGKGSTAAVKSLWDRRAIIGSQATLRVATSPLVAETIGVSPVVLVNGQRAFPKSGSFITKREPRTLLAWDRSGEAWLITVDGRQASSKGWSMAEAADFARSLGATDAVNFDGGGGTTFVVQGKVVNRPSDDAKGDKAGTVRRAVNALAVVPG
jgi:hypothetical protein